MSVPVLYSKKAGDNNVVIRMMTEQLNTGNEDSLGYRLTIITIRRNSYD